MKWFHGGLICCSMAFVAIGCSRDLDSGSDSGSSSAGAADPGGVGSGGGGNGGGGGGGKGGGTGGTVKIECTDRGDCPVPKIQDWECVDATCEGGKCGVSVQLGPMFSQFRGDCKRTDCDASGQKQIVEDPEDIYDDGRVCTIDACKDGKPSNEPYPEGTPCPAPGDGVCHEGKCVECIIAVSPCPLAGQICDGGHCYPYTCQNKCGKGCAPCPPTFSCTDASDCNQGICIAGDCKLPTCFDDVKNASETGIDCGAPSCVECPDGEGCSTHKNCTSGVCWGGICQAPTCTDGLRNGDEYGGIDCGGSCPAVCKDLY